MIDILIGVGLGVAGTYLFTHPEQRGALLSRVTSLVKSEAAWVAGLFKKS
jgi:hypothetical protein